MKTRMHHEYYYKTIVEKKEQNYIYTTSAVYAADTEYSFLVFLPSFRTRVVFLHLFMPALPCSCTFTGPPHLERSFVKTFPIFCVFGGFANQLPHTLNTTPHNKPTSTYIKYNSL